MNHPDRLRRTLAAAALGPTLALGVLGGAARAYAGTGDVSAYGTGAQHIVTLGDSVTAGTACDCDDYGQVLAQDRAARTGGATVTNFGLPGETSQELAAQVTLPEVTDALRGAEVVVVTIGANDIEPADADNPGAIADALSTHLDATITAIRGAAPHARVVVTGYWNVARDGAPAAALGEEYVNDSHKVTDTVNTVLRQRAAANGVLYADLATAYAAATPDITHLLAEDGDHPNAEGHRVIARAVEAELAAAELGSTTATTI